MVLGGTAAIVSGKLLESILFGVTATNPLAYTAGAIALLAAATSAAGLAARRATRMSPVQAMRSE